MISIQWMPLRFSTSSTCKIGRCARWCRKAWLPGPLSMAVSMCQSNNISAGLPITSWRSLGIEENKGQSSKMYTSELVYILLDCLIKLCGGVIALQDAKDVSFCFFSIGKPANVRDRHLRESNGAALTSNFCHSIVN